MEHEFFKRQIRALEYLNSKKERREYNREMIGICIILFCAIAFAAYGLWEVFNGLQS